ncbi:phage Gp37/Gp68 family protein [Alicyclobacillus tolerans]|nr:phage Gp37/Gp68 family protein [Alicyclobacillus tolerans]
MSDLFHEQVPSDFIEEVFAVMAATPQHTYQILTQRPQRMLEWLSIHRAIFVAAAAQQLGLELPEVPVNEWWPLRNVWLGVSVENQAAADERIPLLLQTPAAVRFLSCEPMLGPVDLTRVDFGFKTTDGYRKRRIIWDVLTGWEHQYSEQRSLDGLPNSSSSQDHPTMDWVIAGGESGPNARPQHPDWV